jgi:hypothetical protein
MAIRPISAAASNAATGIARRFIPWAIVNEFIRLVCGVEHRRVSRRSAGCNLIAFLDAFKAIRGLKPSIQTTIPEDAAGEGLREAVAKPPGWGSAA